MYLHVQCVPQGLQRPCVSSHVQGVPQGLQRLCVPSHRKLSCFHKLFEDLICLHGYFVCLRTRGLRILCISSHIWSSCFHKFFEDIVYIFAHEILVWVKMWTCQRPCPCACRAPDEEISNLDAVCTLLRCWWLSGDATPVREVPWQRALGDGSRKSDEAGSSLAVGRAGSTLWRPVLGFGFRHFAIGTRRLPVGVKGTTTITSTTTIEAVARASSSPGGEPMNEKFLACAFRSCFRGEAPLSLTLSCVRYQA